MSLSSVIARREPGPTREQNASQHMGPRSEKLKPCSSRSSFRLYTTMNSNRSSSSKFAEVPNEVPATAMPPKTVSRAPSGKWHSKTWQVFALFRFLMALPGPIFLLFTITQYSRRDSFSGWTGSFTEIEAGKTLAYQVWYASTPVYLLSLLLAKIDETTNAAKPEAHTANTRVWTRPRALEAASYLVCIWAYFLLYYRDHLGLRPDTYAFIWVFANCWFAVMLYFVTIVVRAIKKHQGLKYKSFVLSQASRIGIQTMLIACVTTYALSAMLRVPITGPLLPVFDDLSRHGIACADQAAFLSAFEASAANASCPALPYCGYATYEDLCQAVQYAPMVKGLQDDLNDVHIFIFISWAIVPFSIFGTGRARADDGYSHLLSRHMLVAMVLGVVQLIATLFSFMRLIIVVIRLSVPRPAAYFDRTDVMTKYELPLTCYGECGSIKVWSKYVLYGLILFTLNFDFILKKFVDQLRDPDEAQKELVDQAIKELRSQGWEDDEPSFYFLPAKIVREWSSELLPRMQALRDDGHLKRMSVPLESAFRGNGIIKRILFVSHRWEVPSKPDVDGEQLKAIKAFLEAHPDIEWVWFDYSSMPQGDDRTPMEKAEFQLMLAAIADLYLTARVLILLDGSYASRFWTLTEAWCSMQTVTPEGLRPATEAERRYTISCIHNATDEHDAKGVVDKVSTKTPEEMYRILKKPDVNVTNSKDKEAMLPVLRKINEHVIETFRKQVEPRPASVQTSAAEQVSASDAKLRPTGERAPSVEACSPHGSKHGLGCHWA